MYGVAPYADRPFAAVESIVGFADAILDATATFKFVIHAATREIATNSNDSIMASAPFRGTLDNALTFRRSIVGGDGIGTFTTGDGATTLTNVDGNYDYLPQVFTADGRPIEVKVWRKGDDYARAFTVFKGVMASWFVDEASVAIQVRDFGYKLEVAAQPLIYAGTGDLEGGADIAGKRKPVGVGAPRNVAAVQLNVPFQVYQLDCRAIVAVPAVYDRGSALTFSANYPTYTALVAAVIPPGSYATCLALGLFRLNSDPSGTVTADYVTAINTTADAIRFFVERATDLRYATDFYTYAFDRVNANQPASIDYWLGPDDSQTVADVCANLAKGIGGWTGFRRNGLFEIRRLIFPPVNPVAQIRREDVLSIKREPPPSAVSPPPYRKRVPYARNWTVQADLAESSSADHRAFAAQAYRLSESSSATIRADHPFAQDPDPEPTFFRFKPDADAEALRLLNRDRSERAFYRMELPRKALYLNIGDAVTVTYPRWDLSVGRDMVVVEISENLQAPGEGRVDYIEVVAYG